MFARHTIASAAWRKPCARRLMCHYQNNPLPRPLGYAAGHWDAIYTPSQQISGDYPRSESVIAYQDQLGTPNFERIQTYSRVRWCARPNCLRGSGRGRPATSILLPMSPHVGPLAFHAAIKSILAHRAPLCVACRSHPSRTGMMISCTRGHLRP